MSHPYEPGEVITLRRFKFVGRGKTIGRNPVALHVRSEIVSVRVTGHWKLQSGSDQYVGVPARPNGDVAVWLRRRADRSEQRVFFVPSDVFKKPRRKMEGADDIPVLCL